MTYEVVSYDIHNKVKRVVVSEEATAKAIAATWDDLEKLKYAIWKMGGGSDRRWLITVNGETYYSNYPVESFL